MQLESFLAKKVVGVSAKSAQAVMELTKEGATVPFIARYRKEKTGNLDEVQIRAVIEAAENFEEIVKRKAFLIKEIGEQKNLTEEIKKRIELSWDLEELEEIYRPFKKKKKTKATLAREAGLEPLAQWIWDLGHGLIKGDQPTLEVRAKEYLNPSFSITTYEAALKGAQDILVERLANLPELRAQVLKHFLDKGLIVAKKAKGYKDHSKYEMYQEFEEPIKNLFEAKSSHRYLAMRRGWQEEELSLDFKVDQDLLLSFYNKEATNQKDTAVAEYLNQCAKMALSVYVLPSVNNEVHSQLKKKADEDSILVFSENVRKLLLASPFGARVVLGVDPGLKTGCKVALVDQAGQFISNTVVHILGEKAFDNALKLFSEVLKNLKIEAIAVGNGTAGRETEAFFRKLVKELGKDIPVIMVNESGASVYSASEVAREEFPDLDVTVKGAISIARRLQDPLAELVKIDPKSIGVGQYQHDVSQSLLKKSLDSVVESCVNLVGVDVNTASSHLLSHIAGIGPGLAKSIVEHRKNKGLFLERSELNKIPKFSTKVFEQAAGFLRIPNGKVSLDNTGIHPERYQAVRDMAEELGLGIVDVIGLGAKKLVPLRQKFASIIGEYTFDDIVKELEKPGRDPRDPFKAFQFREDIFEVKDLKEGMICPGIVTNVTNFGAFVDVGVHQDGLVHISELADRFVEDPRKVVSPGDQVKVRVLAVDLAKNQISFSMRLEASEPRATSAQAGFSSENKRSRDQGFPSQGARADRREKGPQGGTRENSPRQPGVPGKAALSGPKQGGKMSPSDSFKSQRGPGVSGAPTGKGRSDDNFRNKTPFNNPFAALLGGNKK